MQMWREHTLLEKVGRGATSEVYRATRPGSDEPVALKVFLRSHVADAQMLARLDKELELQRRLLHPNIVQCHAKFEWNSEIALQFEWIEGRNLKVFQAEYRIPLLEPKFWILAQIARGLGVAHEQGILHRDLKPENVLVSDSGDVKLTDFGLARLADQSTVTQTGSIVGSLPYMAPELLSGEQAAVTSDIFSFGVLAYELITGQLPFRAETPERTMLLLTEGNFISLRQANPRVPAPLAEVIDSCLRKDPKLRPRGIWAVESELMTYLQSSGLLSHCKSLIAIADRDAILASSLRLKYRQLDGLANAPKATRTQQVWVMNELNALFPNHNLFPAIIARTQGAEINSRSMAPLYWAAGFFVLAAVIAVFFVFPRKGPPSTSSVREVAPPRAQIDAGRRERAKPEPVKARILIPPPTRAPGHVRINTDPDVVVHVDGEVVPQSRWGDLELAPGVYRLELAKEGFRPIYRTITVRSGKWTRVNAAGSGT